MRTGAGVEAGGSADCAGHSRGLTATVAAREQAARYQGSRDSGVRSDKDDRGGQDSADILTLRYPGDELAGGVGTRTSPSRTRGLEYLIVGDVGLLRWKGRAEQRPGRGR